MNPDRYQRVTENVYIDSQGPNSPSAWDIWQPRLIKAAGGLACLLLLASVFYPVYLKSRDNTLEQGCWDHLRNLGLSIRQYEQDNEEKFPLVAVNDTDYSLEPHIYSAYGWADALYPYNIGQASYLCPANRQYTRQLDAAGTEVKPDPTELGFTDYWFNRNLSGVATDRVHEPAATFLLGDGNTGRDATDARYSLRAIPTAWCSDPQSPSHRHGGGMGVCYADGHVHWLNGRSAEARAYNRDSFSLDKARGLY